MKRNTMKSIVCVLCHFAYISFLGTTMAQAAFLEGKAMKVDLRHRTVESDPEAIVSSEDFIVGPGVELHGFGFREFPTPLPALVDIDVSDTQVLMTLLIDQPPSWRELFRFFDSNNTIDPIKRVQLNAATNWAGISPSQVSGSAESFAIDVSGLSGLQGQQILLDVFPIPEPAAAGLMTTALAGLAAVRRRR